MSQEIKSIGSILIDARQAKNISLQEASKNTRIHVNILKSMESDDFTTMGAVYAKSFLKLYAEYLNLDKEDIARRFEGAPGEEARASAEKKTGIFRSQPLKGTGIQLQSLAKCLESLKKINFKYVAVIVLVIIVVMGLNRFVHRRRSVFRRPEKTEAKATPAKKSVTAPKAQQEEKIVLVIRAKDKSWLQVKVDGKIVFQSILAKGTAESWQAKEKIELWLGNAGAVQLELNGKLLGKIGRPGQALKRVLVTRAGLSIQS